MEVEVKGEKVRKKGTDMDDFREILTLFSDKVPGLIKGVVNSFFSEDTARGMGKAAATYYQELKAGGLPDAVAVQMTQDYVQTFTKISEMFKSASRETSNKSQKD